MDLAQAFTPPKLSRNAIEALYASAHSLLSQEHFADAAPLFRVMVHAAPTDERGWLALGACHEGLEQFGIACEIFGAASMVCTRPGKCHVARARALRVMGQDEKAEEALELAFAAADVDDDEILAAAIAYERSRS